MAPGTDDDKASRARKLPRLSLADRAFLEIKQRIVTTAYPPGAQLNEAQLSHELGLGRTPVHHALHRLAAEELVDIRPRKGVTVRPISFDEVAQIIEVRLVNEPYCSAQAASRVSQADLEEPKEYLAQASAELGSGKDISKLMEYDRRFHAWITRIAGNRVMADMLASLQDRSSRFWFLSLSDGDHSARVQEEHTQILRAIGRRDQNAAAAAARRHIESFRNAILKVL